MKALLTLLIFTSLNSNEATTNADSAPLLKESLMLTLERTPCMAQCPNYTIRIFNTGKVEYNGIDFVEKTGKYSSTLSQAELKHLVDKIDAIQLFDLQDKYDTERRDIGACSLYINLSGKKKKIFDRDGGPAALKEFEKLVDALVINSNLTKAND